jgi:CRP-like cAMP-binding protein
MPFSENSDLQPFLNRLMARSVLSEQERAAILRLPSRASQVHAHHDCVRMGERVDHSCLVVEGIVGRFSQNAEGHRQITALHVAGDMADLHSVVRPVGTSALQALSTATILRVPHAALRALAGRYPAIAEAFWRDCMVDAAVLSQWVMNVGRRDARCRLAHLLCEMAVRFGKEGEPALIYPFAVTQLQLADACSLTAVHVNRTLKQLRDNGLVRVRSRTVQILDWDGLATVGDFDDEYLKADTRSEERHRLLNPSQNATWNRPASL